MIKTISLEFDGYWCEGSDDIPKKSGIYCVYTCVNNPSKDTIIQKMIYIGESNNVSDRISGHEKKSKCWNTKLNSDEVLCYSFAPANEEDRKRAEAALIYKHKPTCNEEYVNEFPYDETTVISTGKTGFLESPFTVFTQKHT